MVRKKIPQALYRALVIEARGLCSLCHELPIQEIHHIVPVAEGGDNDYSNLIPICASCHSKVHSFGIKKDRLFEEKQLWTTQNEKIISQIIMKHESLSDTLHALTNSFSTLTNTSEYDLFQGRLRKLLSDNVVFENFARIKKHEINKIVDEKADCWTDESMKISTLLKTKSRTMHIRGDGHTFAEQAQFSAFAMINKKNIDCNVTLTRDDPTFKSYKIIFDNTILKNKSFDLSFRYCWCNTWDFYKDFYSYDILSWVDLLSYHFKLPNKYLITNAKGFLIDILGREWEDYGYCSWENSSFDWEIKKPPLFCTAVVRYDAIENSKINRS